MSYHYLGQGIMDKAKEQIIRDHLDEETSPSKPEDPAKRAESKSNLTKGFSFGMLAALVIIFFVLRHDRKTRTR